MNPGGDVATWNEQEKNGSWQTCQGIVRREDGLVFRNTLSCRACDDRDFPMFTHAKRLGDFLEGQDKFGTKYSQAGRVLPTLEEVNALHRAQTATRP
jgi:hypothetical protein